MPKKDAAHSHFGPVGGSVSDKPWNGAASRFSDAQYQRACAACNPGDEPPKERCFLPHHEPDGTVSRAGVHAAAARAGQVQGNPAAKARAKAHLRAHYAQLKEEPPDSLKASQVAVEMAEEACPTCGGDGKIRAGKVTCPECGGSGQVEAARSAHDHEENAVDESETDTTAAAHPAGVLSFIAGQAAYEPAGAFDMMGASWGILQDGARWQVLVASGQPWEGNPVNRDLVADGGTVRWNEAPGYDSYVEAERAIAEQLAVAGSDRPVLAVTWRADSAFEDVSTGDGRRISAGATEYRNPPLPLMLQTQTAGGHQGAVLAGTIEQTGMDGKTAVTSGTYDDTEAGRQAQQIVAARSSDASPNGRFGVSIDVAEAEGSMECTEEDEDGACMSAEIVFSKIRIMGQTMTPFPAFENAFIENVAAPDAEQASGAPIPLPEPGPETPPEPGAGEHLLAAAAAAEVVLVEGCDDCGPVIEVGGERVDPATLVAAGGPTRPPAAWFEDPGFTGHGDPRMIRQPDGHYLCPLTVERNGRVYGHFAGRYSCHTGRADRCERMPHSNSNYAAFHLRPVDTDAGELLVGYITMGCGHAEVTRGMSVQDVRDHYDGGPGAVRVAKVRCGEDQFGGWFAGSLEDGLTDAQVRRFRGLSVSGDWRTVWQGRGLELVACLAGVTVPGFPVAAMAAAGVPVLEEDFLGEEHLAFEDGAVVAMVAAGVVRQPQPWEWMIAAANERIDELEARVAAAERIAEPLRPMAATRLLSRAKAATNGHPQPVQ